ncbi:MAG TPA: HAMP domain-containing sensor histidine kinase [Acidimicrobiales bacterium]|jgi:two-component system sensor histidine kinase MprB|nr:HAMP domain-containing sensor histidine kinase [Acidimicrobiales bacterium]
MTFRIRLVVAATAAVLVVVVLASLATYLVAYNSLVGSVDANLTAQARVALATQSIRNGCSTTTLGDCVQVVLAGGSTNQGDVQVLPATDTVKASAASQGRAADTFFSTTVSGTAVREIVSSLPPGYVYQSNLGPVQTPAGGGALQITNALTGVNQELSHLAKELWLIVLVGVVVAVALGLAMGRTLLRPLNSLTGAVEELAKSTDGATGPPKRLDPGGPDELGRLRRAFNQLLSALDSSRDSQRQLVLDASHELRTPVTSLRTNMEVARRLEELEPEERQVLINDVITQLDELTTLVGDLAELARGEQPRLTDEPFRFDQVVLDSVEVATTHGRSRGVVFEPRVAPTWVSGSSTRIGRAVDNLLDNALKWSPDQGVVEVTCADGVLVVRDHGPGVDATDADFVFDRFYRAPSARGRPGSGLGLAIVAQVARDEGGSVNVYQAEGGGALFRFSLPVVPPPEGGTDAGPD